MLPIGLVENRERSTQRTLILVVGATHTSEISRAVAWVGEWGICLWCSCEGAQSILSALPKCHSTVAIRPRPVLSRGPSPGMSLGSFKCQDEKKQSVPSFWLWPLAPCLHISLCAPKFLNGPLFFQIMTPPSISALMSDLAFWFLTGPPHLSPCP